MSAQTDPIDKLAKRWFYRVALFKRRRWAPDRAEAFADVLWIRDEQRDERRACIECSELQRQGTCFPATQGRVPGVTRSWNPPQDLLQRCAHFNFQRP